MRLHTHQMRQRPRKASVAAAVVSALLLPACAKRPGPAASAGVGPRWDDGTHVAYRMTMSSLTAMGADNVLIDLRLTGGLDLFARRIDDGRVELSARLGELKVAGESSGGDAKLAGLVQDLQRPWVIELKGGLVDAIRVPSGVLAAAVGIERTLAAALQFAPPPSAGARQWDAAESDATGRYAVTYRALAEPGRFSKQKLRYDSLLFGLSNVRPGVQLAPSGSGKADLPEVTSSSAEIELADGRIRSSHDEEQTRAMVTTGTSVSSKTTLTLTLTAADQASPPPEVARAGDGCGPSRRHRSLRAPDAAAQARRGEVGRLDVRARGRRESKSWSARASRRSRSRLEAARRFRRPRRTPARSGWRRRSWRCPPSSVSSPTRFRAPPR